MNRNLVRENIEAQGFCGLKDDVYEKLNYPLRLSPAICMVWAAIGTALSSHVILWALVPFAALGAILPAHPFDLIYKFGLRMLNNGPEIPRYPIRRRFACVLATTMLVISALGFQLGYPAVGLGVGWALVAAAFVNVSTGFCVPSFIVRIFFGKVVCS